MTDLDRIKSRLRRFGEHDAVGISPLYAHLATRAADDDEVAGLLATRGTAPDAHVTLLFAAAHRLVQADPVHPLSRYYASLGGLDGVDAQTWPLFREFLLERADGVRELLRTRFTQTNEVRRAAIIFPAVAMVAAQAGSPVGLLEVGCSAGLLLGMDRFSYRYQCEGGEVVVAGPAKSPIGLHCAVEFADGAALPKLPKKLAVGAKLGLDRAPMDVSDDDELAWLEACVWADQPERIRLLRTAAAAQRRNPPELVAGDAVDDLAAVAARVPAELPLIVYTSHVLAYFSDERQQAFLAALRDIAADRRLWWVSLENYQAGLRYVLPGRDDLDYGRTAQPVLAAVTWRNGEPEAQTLAQAPPHGGRMTWLAS